MAVEIGKVVETDKVVEIDKAAEIDKIDMAIELFVDNHIEQVAGMNYNIVIDMPFKNEM